MMGQREFPQTCEIRCFGLVTFSLSMYDTRLEILINKVNVQFKFDPKNQCSNSWL
jgi:hypothetical protein